jgi:hypothetical protein
LLTEVRLVDLRDQQLARIGVARNELVDTDPRHYPCTRRWAEAVRSHPIDGRVPDGAVGHSRQADLHARTHREGVLGALLRHRAVEVAVLWRPPEAANPLAAAGGSFPLLHQGEPAQLVRELAALLGVPIE